MTKQFFHVPTKFFVSYAFVAGNHKRVNVNGVFRFCFRSFFLSCFLLRAGDFFMFYFLLFFSCFVTFSVLEVEGAGRGGGRTKDTKKIYKEYMIALARSLEKPEKN